jgi:hypothetical protein
VILTSSRKLRASAIDDNDNTKKIANVLSIFLIIWFMPS